MAQLGNYWRGVSHASGFVTPLSGALAYKGVVFGGYLACMLLLHSLVRHGKKNGAASVLFFTWNPLVLIQGVGNSHNDVLMLAWVLLALLVWQRSTCNLQVIGRSLLGVAAATLALLTKMPAGLMSVLLVLNILRDIPARRRTALLVAMAGVVAVLALLAFAPFWPPWHSIVGVLDEMSHRYTCTIAATLRLWLSGFLSAQAAWDAPRTAGRLLFVGVLGWTSLRLWQRRLDLASASFLAFRFSCPSCLERSG